jgi:hypothetical protein
VIDSRQLPPDFDLESFGQTFVLQRDPSGGFGETLLARRGRSLLVFGRPTTLENWSPLVLKPGATPTLEGGGWQRELVFSLANGATARVEVLTFDVEQVEALLYGATTSGGRRPPEVPSETPTDPELPAVAAEPVAKTRRVLGVVQETRTQLEQAAVQAMESGRYDLAVASFRRLAEVSAPEARTWYALARVASHLADGEPEAAFVTLNNEVEDIVTPGWVVSRVTGSQLVAGGRMALAAAAFMAPAVRLELTTHRLTADCSTN